MARRLYLGSKSAQCVCTCAIHPRFRSIGLPPDARSDDVAKFFDGYGRIVDCRVMTGEFRHLGCVSISQSKLSGFGFVEFENSRVSSPVGVCFALLSWFQDAEDAVHHFNGKMFMGAK